MADGAGVAIWDRMKAPAIVIAVLIAAAVIYPAIRFSNETLAPLFLNSRIERLGEKNLPRILVQEGNLYCRMKADDFRFPLPVGARVSNAVVSGGFDTVHGSIEAHFDGADHVTASDYVSSVSRSLRVGGQVSAETIPSGFVIKFNYFGDR